MEPLAGPVTYWFKLEAQAGAGGGWEPHLIDDNTGVGTQVMVADVTRTGSRTCWWGTSWGRRCCCR